MKNNMYDEKGLLKPEYEMSFEQRMSMNTNNDSVDRPKDNTTDAGRGYPEPIDNRTDYGRGIVYKGWDGKEFASMDEVMQYNEMFYKSMMINTEEKGMRR